MGKQINFYMGNDIEPAFVEHILKDGQILYEGNNPKPVSLTTLPKPFSSKDWYTVYLYKPEFGEIVLKELPSGVQYVDSMRSPVIEFSRTVIRDSAKEVSRGRLWMEMRYWDSEENLVEKPKELDQWYASLSRWIRKNLTRIEHLLQGHPYKEYVSPSIKDLVDKGYKLM